MTHCMDCGKALSYSGVRQGAKRCKLCTAKVNIKGAELHITPEIRKKIAASRVGIPLSDAHKKKLSEIRTGEKNPFWGKHHRPETVERIRMTHYGKDNSHYRDGRGNGPYPGNWPSVRETIGSRDGGLCQHPGCYLPENGRRHDCHHIDRNRSNNDPSNLILLCQKHHSATKFGDPDCWIEFYDSVQSVRGINRIFKEVTHGYSRNE